MQQDLMHAYLLHTGLHTGIDWFVRIFILSVLSTPPSKRHRESLRGPAALPILVQHRYHPGRKKNTHQQGRQEPSARHGLCIQGASRPILRGRVHSPTTLSCSPLPLLRHAFGHVQPSCCCAFLLSCVKVIPFRTSRSQFLPTLRPLQTDDFDRPSVRLKDSAAEVLPSPLAPGRLSSSSPPVYPLSTALCSRKKTLHDFNYSQRAPTSNNVSNMPERSTPAPGRCTGIPTKSTGDNF